MENSVESVTIYEKLPDIIPPVMDTVDSVDSVDTKDSEATVATVLDMVDSAALVDGVLDSCALVGVTD